MMRRVGEGMLVVVLCAAPASGQRPAGSPRWASVTYLTTASAYIDAGRAEGVTQGMRLEVIRGDTSVAVLRVAFLATHQAACDIVSATGTLVVGDSVRFTPVVPPPDSGIAGVARTAAPPVFSSRAGGVLRGRVGFYYFGLRQLDGSGATFSEPSGDLRLSGTRLGQTGFGLDLDVRSRRVTQARPDGFGTTAWGQTRVYQARVDWQQPGSPLRVAVGRQFAPGIATVGLVDGVSAQLDGPGVGGGVFVGKQPDPVNLAFSGDLTDLGIYIERHSPINATTRRWSLVGGLSGSYLGAGTNREFLYLQGDYRSRRLSVYAAQEVDYYRPWRRVDGEAAFSPTSSFATLQFRLTDAVALTAGLDNRRSVRLYQDVVNPEVAFDDAFRRGAWVGVSARAGRVEATLDSRSSGGGPAGPAASYTASFGVDRLTGYGLSLRTRTTRYTSAARAGWLQSLSLGVEPWGLGLLQVTGGWRREQADTIPLTASAIQWISTDLDVNLGRAWAVVVSAYREWGGIEAHDLVYAGLTLRF
ncbi:MAG TPA: hypothetical protein VFI79_03230 [Gemmatimonadales bacterium]|nr:hypothetical protein [Gemmatimonadales bacterium]